MDTPQRRRESTVKLNVVVFNRSLGNFFRLRWMSGNIIGRKDLCLPVVIAELFLTWTWIPGLGIMDCGRIGAVSWELTGGNGYSPFLGKTKKLQKEIGEPSLVSLQKNI